MYRTLFDLAGLAIVGWLPLMFLPKSRVSRWLGKSMLFPVRERRNEPADFFSTPPARDGWPRLLQAAMGEAPLTPTFASALSALSVAAWVAALLAAATAWLRANPPIVVGGPAAG